MPVAFHVYKKTKTNKLDSGEIALGAVLAKAKERSREPVIQNSY